MIKYTSILLFCVSLSFGTTNTFATGIESIAMTQGVSAPQELNSILNQLIKLYNVNIIFDDKHVQGITIKAFEPTNTSIDKDLLFLLKDTKLVFEKISDDTYIIKRQKQVLKKSQSKEPESALIPQKVSVTIMGIVVDSDDQEPLVGVNIVDIQTKQGTVTDYDGSFTIEVQEESTLRFSYIGYLSIDKSVNSDLSTVYLEKDVNLIEEVVVVGYGSQKKSDLTGAVARISEEELKQLPTTGLEQALQGRSAGVFITQNSGAPGGAMSVRIRGTGSTLTAEPLYVIDGIPIVNDNAGTSATFESDGGGQFPNALTTINPNDIESIEILKDASATAIYGARAANGVVLITTKKGSNGKATIAYDTYIGAQELYKRVDVLNLRQYADYIIDVGLGDLEEFENLDLLGEGTDWQDAVFRRALMHNHQFSLTGGNEKTRFSFTAGAHFKDGTVEGSDFNRYSAKLNVDHNFSEKFRLGTNILASRTKENITFNDNSNGVIYTALLTPPLVPDRLLDGSYGAPPDGENIVLTFDNPLANAQQIDDVNRKTRLLGSVWAEYNITNWMKYRTELSTDILFSNHNTFWPAFDRGTQSRRSRVRRNINNSFYWINKHLFTFNASIAEKHNVTFLAGFEAQEGTYEWLFAARDNLPTNELSQLNLGDAGTQQLGGGAGHWSLLSYFGRLNYGFSDRYLLTATARVDGSSRFGPNNRYGFFPSLAVAWRASNEPFLKDIDQLSNLKLRFGYGAVGNQEIGFYSFSSILRAVQVVIGDNLTTGFAPDNIANSDVKWESSVQFNVGLDFGLFNNRLEIIFDAYRKTSRDMLLPAILPATAGSLNPPFINVGEMENAGLEFTLNTQNFTGKLNWSTTATISTNRNEVIDLGSTGTLNGIIQRIPVTRTVEGQPIGQFFGHEVEGVFQDLNEVTESPIQEVGTRPGDIKFKDLNNDGIISDEDRTFIGSPHPDFTANFINDIGFKNFDLNIFFRGVFGNEVLNLLRRDLAGTGAWHNQTVDIIDRWTVDNPDGTEPRPNGNDPNRNRRISDRFIEDGSYIRLQNVTLGYSFPKALITRWGFQKVRAYVSGQNLLTISDYSGFDPELGSFNQNPLLNGIDNGRFPVARSLTIGLNVQF